MGNGNKAAARQESELGPEGFQDARKRRFAPVLAVQLVAYALLLATSFIPSGEGNAMPQDLSFPFTLCVAVPMVVLLTLFSPLQDGVPGRVVSVLCGLAASAVAITAFVGNMIFQKRSGDVGYVMPQAWLAACGALLIVLLVCAFIRQMARQDRSNLITQMSQMILDGVCAICASGWAFLPSLWQLEHADDAAAAPLGGRVWVLCIAVVLLVAVLLGLASALWCRDMQPKPGAVAPWLGLGLMPVMLTGGVVGAAALCASIW